MLNMQPSKQPTQTQVPSAICLTGVWVGKRQRGRHRLTLRWIKSNVTRSWGNSGRTLLGTGRGGGRAVGALSRGTGCLSHPAYNNPPLLLPFYQIHTNSCAATWSLPPNTNCSTFAFHRRPQRPPPEPHYFFAKPQPKHNQTEGLNRLYAVTYFGSPSPSVRHVPHCSALDGDCKVRGKHGEPLGPLHSLLLSAEGAPAAER